MIKLFPILTLPEAGLYLIFNIIFLVANQFDQMFVWTKHCIKVLKSNYDSSKYKSYKIKIILNLF